MWKGTDLIGKPIINYDCGSKLATVKDLIFSQGEDALVALMTEEPGWLKDAKIVSVPDILAIGPDAIIIKSADSIVSASEIPMVKELIDRQNILRGTQIMTVSGRNLGKMVDLYFDAQTGRVAGYEVSGGIFADAYTGRSFVPIHQTIRIGKDFAFVPDGVVELMEEQVGGLKGTVIAASDKAQTLAQQAGDKAQEIGNTTVEKLGEAQSKAITVLTDAVITPAEQKQFVVGRTIVSDVYAPNGVIFLRTGHLVSLLEAEQAEALGLLDTLYRATGGDVVAVAKDKASLKAEEIKQVSAEKLDQATTKVQSTAEEFKQIASEKLDQANLKTQAAVANYTVDETLGRRVRFMVYNSYGEVIAAAGQIVTQQTIETAHRYHQEKALMNATGLSVTQAAKSQSNLIAHQAGNQVREVSEQVQSHTSSALEWAKQKADNLFDRSSSAIEEQRIKGALGRPVNRVILDMQDQVLLNVGELVTHQAIADARQAGVLDILLSSIHDGIPNIGNSEMRARQNGHAALPMSR